MPTSSDLWPSAGRLSKQSPANCFPGAALYRATLKILILLQRVVAQCELFLAPFQAWLFGWRGIYYNALLRSEDGFVDAERFFSELEEPLKNATEIKVAAGEVSPALLGNRRFSVAFQEPKFPSSEGSLFEAPPAMPRFVVAHQEQHIPADEEPPKKIARIEILHGPRVDPSNIELYDRAKDGKVEIYRTQEYRFHHFYLITDASGQVTVMDEGTHNETQWVKDASGRWTACHQSRVRCYYISHSKRRAALLRKKYEDRKKTAVRIFSHPGINPPQDYSAIELVIEFVANIPIKHFLQPISIFIELPLDLMAEDVYTVARQWFRNLNSRIRKEAHTVGKETYSLKELPEWTKGHPIEDVTLNISLEGIPTDGPQCEVCGRTTKRTLIQYFCGDKVIVRAKQAPGYRCPEDGFEYLSPETLMEFLPIARDELRRRGEMVTAKALDEAFELEKERLSLSPV